MSMVEQLRQIQELGAQLAISTPRLILAAQVVALQMGLPVPNTRDEALAIAKEAERRSGQ